MPLLISINAKRRLLNHVLVEQADGLRRLGAFAELVPDVNRERDVV
jgi:hypothetical protein